MKILKKCTGAKLTSFKVIVNSGKNGIDLDFLQLKFAVDQALNDKKYEEGDIGSSMQRVMKYWTVRDKMNSVHDDLVEEGVTKIEVTDEGLVFCYSN